MFLSISTELLRSNLLCFRVCPFSMVLSLGTTGKNLALSSPHPPCRCLYTLARGQTGVPPRGNSSPWISPAVVHLTVTVLCSVESPFRKAQPFRYGLLQSRSLMGPRVLPGNLLQRGILSPWVCSSPPRACSGTVFPQVDSPLSGITLLRPGLLPGLQGHRVFTTAFPTGCGGTSALGAAPAPRSPLPWLSAELFLSCALTPLSSGCNYLCTITNFSYS